MRRLPAWARLVLTAVVALCTAGAILSVPSANDPAGLDLALAADTSQFDAGNIISDAMFFDYNALSAQQVSDFIAAKGSGCVANGGIPCLKNYTETTWTRGADGICPGTYTGGANESAGTIIWKVGQACRISPKVLLVLVQKEQGLLTASGGSLTARKYQIATGYGCPDTAACDSQYYGFYNQVYNAAHQFDRYPLFPSRYAYHPGVMNTIPWSPDSSCGTSPVWIANQATADLYNYTPYRPNAAALRAGYGTGDGCSAYGNRNFWLYFTDWFGSTQSPGGDALLSAYAARGGASGPLGPYTTWVICGLGNNGCGQVFQNGTLYWSAATGVHAVTEPYLTAWGANRERGPLGYPTSETICGLRDGGCGQVFEGGRIYTSPSTGTHALTGPIHATWVDQGFEKGPLGYPVGDLICGLRDGGCGQVFQGGRMYTSPSTGAHAVSGVIQDGWIAQGWENGLLGYPTAEAICGLKDSGCGQAFQGGRIYTSPGTGTHAVSGAIQNAWIAQGWENGTLGYPTGDQVCGLADGGCKQTFQGGAVYSSPQTGAYAVAGAIATAYATAGAESGTLGYPTSGLLCPLRNNGCGQVFQNGRIYSVPLIGTYALTGVIQDAWIAQGWENGPLGYPTGDQTCGLAGGGCKQTFQGGSIYSPYPTAGAKPISGDIAAAWQKVGAENGSLGYPTSDIICGLKDGGCGQVFQGGRIYTSPGTGTHAVSGAIQNAWIAQGWEKGPLGYPTGDQTCGLADGGCKQTFQGGSIYSSPGTGTHAVSGTIATTWLAAGAEGGSLGYPTSDLICGLKNSGCGQVFQGGRIYTTTATGAHSVSGAIQDAWIAQGWENGPLGYPTSEPYTVSGGTAQDFKGGTLILDSATGTVRRG